MKSPNALAAVIALLAASAAISPAHAAEGITGRVCTSTTSAGGCVGPHAGWDVYFYKLDPNTYLPIEYSGVTVTNSSGAFGKSLSPGVYEIQTGIQGEGGCEIATVFVESGKYNNIGSRVCNID